MLMSDKLTYKKLDLKQAIIHNYLLYRPWIGLRALLRAFSHLSLLPIVVMIKISTNKASEWLYLIGLGKTVI